MLEALGRHAYGHGIDKRQIPVDAGPKRLEVGLAISIQAVELDDDGGPALDMAGGDFALEETVALVLEGIRAHAGGDPQQKRAGKRQRDKGCSRADPPGLWL